MSDTAWWIIFFAGLVLNVALCFLPDRGDE